MSSSRHRRSQEIFEKLLPLPPEARPAALDRLCADDASMRDEVERLLVDAERSDLLDDDAIDRGAHLRPAGGSLDRARADAIEGFRILRLLGEGGMGAVYEAEQDRPRRRVALKVIRSSLVTETMRRRFGREAEALGRLKHPGIAQVYSVGLGDDSSQPYIAMELIEGQPVTAYAEAEGVGLRERLKLAAQLCDAVEHAHQHGVIHRDLKPANVLVDQAGRLKILDFGIARLTEGDVLLTSLRTEPGQIVGTAAYMSPEQASGDPDDLDTRSDVYSLGVVIFELLSGRLPVDVERLALPDAIRAIREREATRIGTIDSRLRGDVETMLAKALEHDKPRRYQSASEFGADIRRFLQDEPIVARPPSTIYQLRKFARRHRLLVSAVCAVVVALSVGLVASTVALQREGAARLRAEESLARAQTSKQFLEDMLKGLRIEETEGLDTTLVERMLAGAEEALGEVVDSSVVRADLLAVLGQAHYWIWNYDRAIEFFRESDELFAALGPQYDSSRDSTRLVYADALMKSGRTDEAAEMLVAAMDRFAEAGDVTLTVQATRQLAELRMDAGRWDEALELAERARAQAVGVPDLELGRVEMLRGAVLRRLVRLGEAREAYLHAQELFEAGDGKVELVIILNSLGVLARDEGHLEDAERFYRDALELRQTIDPRPNHSAATMLSNLGRLLTSLDRLDEAASVLEESLEMHEVVLGEDHFTVGFPAVSLGEVYSQRGDHEAGLKLIERGVGLIEAQFGRAHPVYVGMMSRLGGALHRAGRLADAFEAYSTCLELVGELPGDQLALVLSARIGLAEVQQQSGDTEGAIRTLEVLADEPALSDKDVQRVQELLTEHRSSLQRAPG